MIFSVIIVVDNSGSDGKIHQIIKVKRIRNNEGIS